MSRPLSIWLLSTCAIVLVTSCSIPGMSDSSVQTSEPTVITVTGSEETLSGSAPTATGSESASGAARDTSATSTGAMTPAEIRAERRRQRDEAQQASGATDDDSSEVDAESAEPAAPQPPQVAPSPSSSPAPSPSPAAATAPTQPAPQNTPPASAGVSGTFTVNGDYSTPAGMEKANFIVTVSADVVTSVKLAKIADNGVSARFQNMFLDGAKTQILGKKLSEIQNVDRVGGASLTSGGFNTAIKKV